MQVTNFPRQMSVVQLGGISYYVRSRVEVHKNCALCGTND
jgi:hypothetical protein